MQAITDHYDIAEAAVQSVKAGGDMMLVAHNDAEVANVFKALKSAVKNGDIPGERIDESVQRIIKLKEKYRLSDDPAPKPDVSDINKKAKKILQAVS
jgi:beta-N-acetylhexosaminidase